jgi:hypothetical protein
MQRLELSSAAIEAKSMTDGVQKFIEFLESEIRAWEKAAQFSEQIDSVQFSDSVHRTGKQEAEGYRARIAEIRDLIEQLRNG